MHYIKMIDISRKTHERNGIETIIDNDEILWLNEKRIKEGLDHKDLQKNYNKISFSLQKTQI